MSMIFTSESEIEKNLINELVSGVSQWTYRPDLKSEEDLWDNFKQKLENNNVDVLNEVPLTPQEFQQIKIQLTFPTFVDASTWLSGENGIAKVQVQREDASLGTIRLSVFWREDIAGGHSSYEIVNQIKKMKNDEMDRNRRFDITLLMNGLPMIQIEVKNRAHSYTEAFTQIQTYLTQGKYTGIFSSLQMFVVSNGSDTRYIASAVSGKLKQQFLSTWVDKNNRPVTKYLEFAEQVLSIPQAHKMVTQYTVIDSAKKALILLRPYQIHAIEAIREASKRHESGYVWHTTGSGKTLTSYKAARNLLQIPSLDKTIFIVDRIDLDQQTTSNFISYAEHDVIEIDETDNVRDLIKKLLSPERTVIITTIQKLNFVMRRAIGKENTPRYKKLRDLRLAFIVDECHRAISPQKQQEIKKFFTHSLWYGFTGTPIFKENAKKEVGNLARTTEEQYGQKLHEYTVKEAILDKAVLGFLAEYKTTISEDTLYEIIKKRRPEVDVSTMDRFEKESVLTRDDFENEDHMLEVLDFIINKSKLKFGMDKGSGKTYTALFTTSSIQKAQRYYSMLKDIVDGRSTVKISDSIQKAIPDFPKFAITYSLSENEDGSIVNQEKMTESISDYNEMFGTKFSIETIKSYNVDINDRLARKQEKYQYRNEQLDFVIVVDRLLTGFDAPCMSILFVDRAFKQPHDLIQAFSRTNRIFDGRKKHGQIVTFQTPSIMKYRVDGALKLYSNGGENYILAPDYETAKHRFTEAVVNLYSIAPTPESADSLHSLQELKKFAKSYQEFDRTLTAVRVYSEFEDELKMSPEDSSIPTINLSELEEYRGKYENVLERIKELTEKEGVEPDGIEIEYELESFTSDQINYQYILGLIQVYVPKRNEIYEKPSEKNDKEILKYLEDLSQRNSKLSTVVQDLWEEIKEEPIVYEDQQISILLEERIDNMIDQYANSYAEKWYIDPSSLRFYIDNYKPQKNRQTGEAELKKSAFDHYSVYKEQASDPIPKLRYWTSAREDIQRVVNEDILPLRDK